MLSNNPSVSFADSSPYTGEPTAAAGLLNGKSLYGTTRLAGGFRFTINIPCTCSVQGIFIVLFHLVQGEAEGVKISFAKICYLGKVAKLIDLAF